MLHDACEPPRKCIDCSLSRLLTPHWVTWHGAALCLSNWQPLLRACLQSCQKSQAAGAGWRLGRAECLLRRQEGWQRL